jgi:hypothetical protein
MQICFFKWVNLYRYAEEKAATAENVSAAVHETTTRFFTERATARMLWRRTHRAVAASFRAWAGRVVGLYSC